MKMEVIGRLGANIEEKTTKKGTSFAVLRLAESEYGDQPDWFNIVAFGKRVEQLKKVAVGRGDQLFIFGHIVNDNYTNKNGEKVYSNSFILDNFVVGARAKVIKETKPENQEIPSKDERLGKNLQAPLEAIPDDVLEDIIQREMDDYDLEY